MKLLKENTTIDKIRGRFSSLNPLPYFFNKSYSENESICLIDGDLELQELSLEINENNTLSIIIINGNLTVKGLIWNSEIDYGINLLVLGDLKAKNIATGGQLISVWGNLTVEEILCGSYNHGEMYVSKNISAKIIVADDYCFTVGGNFFGIKMGNHGFYHSSTKTWLEADYEDWDYIFDETVLDEYGFNFDKFIDKIKSGEVRTYIDHTKTKRIYNFKPLLIPFLTSNVIPANQHYTFTNYQQSISISKDYVYIETQDEKKFRYSIDNERVIIENIEDDLIVNIEKLPDFMTSKAYRILKLANDGLNIQETKLEIRMRALLILYDLAQNVFEKEQYERVKKRVELALKNPIQYCNEYHHDCIRRNENSYSSKLHISSLIDSLVSEGIAVSLVEKQSLEEAKNALIKLPKLLSGYNEGKFSQIKWGRKLFAFCNDILVMNEALPSNSLVIVRVFRNSPDEVVLFLVDRKPLIDIKLKQFFKMFEIN